MTEEQVFLAALDLPDRANRTAYLDEVCGQDSELRRQVEELLAAHERSGQFLDQPAADQIAAGPQLSEAQTLASDVEGADAMADNKKTNSPSPQPSPQGRGQGEGLDSAGDLPFLSPSTRPDSLGRIGHYEMLQVLGKGGFGIVFRAFDDILQRVVAVKVMAPQIATLSPARKRFLREARSSAAVRHENVVHVYEVGEQPLPYLVMEFIPGETLKQKLDRCGPLDVPETLRIGRQIAEGLAAAHASDLIHRDIKPGNILLEGGSHKAKITDFGLARAADDASISQSGIVAGTPMFMAPEQALGHKLDHRADLFSLGSVLYQMVSGRPPFRAPGTLAVMKRVADETPRPITEIIPETPDWMCGIITKLHAKNPADRFQSAREVADLLADCEAKLKAKQEVKNILPAAVKPANLGASVRRKWVAAAAVLLLPVIALAVTEFTGVTHLFRGQQPAFAPIKPGPEPTPPIQVAKLDTPPLAIVPFDADKAKEHQEAWARHLGVEPAITNSVGMKMRLIPPGDFTMGTPPEILAQLVTEAKTRGTKPDQLTRLVNEGVPHPVRLTRPFYLGTHEVTRGQFRKFVQATQYKTEMESNGVGGWAHFQGEWVRRPEHVWQTPGDWQPSDDEPAVQLTWNDANAFCAWLSRSEGAAYTLPTEAQWEFACRAGTDGVYYPSKYETLAEYAWTNELREKDTHGPRPVGLKKPNAFGLFDMLGNASEHCSDWYGPGPTTTEQRIDPVGPPQGLDRLTRGGAWFLSGRLFARCSARGFAKFAHAGLGFRVALVEPFKRPLDSKQLSPAEPSGPLAVAIREGRYKAPDLSQAKPIYEDRFQDATSGWHKEKGDDYETGYLDGRFFIAIPPTQQRWVLCPARPPANIACEVVGRRTGGPNSSWYLKLNNDARQHFLEFRLFGKQELRITALRKKEEAKRTLLRVIHHPAIKPGEAFNKLLVIARGQSYEVYVNGVLVCEPLTTDFLTMPVTLSLAAAAPSKSDGSRAEFERITIWSADGLPRIVLP